MRFDEDTGLNIGLKQRGGHVRGGRRPKVGHVGGVGRGEGSDRGGGAAEPEQTIVFEVPPELVGQVKKDSVLLAINNVPVRHLSEDRVSGWYIHTWYLVPGTWYAAFGSEITHTYVNIL